MYLEIRPHGGPPGSHTTKRSHFEKLIKFLQQLENFNNFGITTIAWPDRIAALHCNSYMRPKWKISIPNIIQLKARESKMRPQFNIPIKIFVDLWWRKDDKSCVSIIFFLSKAALRAAMCGGSEEGNYSGIFRISF